MSTHCHDDLGLAVANSLAGVRAGATQVECTINGIGERAGNACLEEIVMALHTRRDYWGHTTAIETRELYRSSRLVAMYTGMVVPPNKAVVGDNAFAHESGIHQDGVLKALETYEIMSAETVGRDAGVLVMGKHSGRRAFRKTLVDLGYADLPDDTVNLLFKRFKDLCDRKQSVTSDDIRALVDVEAARVPATYVLEAVQFQSGTGMTPVATVRLDDRHRDVRRGGDRRRSGRRGLQGARAHRPGGARPRELRDPQRRQRQGRARRGDRAHAERGRARSTAAGCRPTSSRRPRCAYVDVLNKLAAGVGPRRGGAGGAGVTADRAPTGDLPLRGVRVALYDTTLRDGTQAEGVSFTSDDKIAIARRLDAFGMDGIEGGWPGSNPRDAEFFERMRDVPLHARPARRLRRHPPEGDRARGRRQPQGADRRRDARW